MAHTARDITLGIVAVKLLLGGDRPDRRGCADGLCGVSKRGRCFREAGGSMHLSVYTAHGVSSGRRGRVRYTGAELCACSPGTPRSRSSRDGRLQRGPVGVGAVPVARRRLPAARVRAIGAGRPRGPRRGVPRPAARRLAGDRRSLVDTVGHVVDLGADFRLPRAATSSGMARRTPRPSCSTGSRSGFPSSTAPRSAAARHVAAPGCYPTTACARACAAARDGLVEPTGIVVDAVSGVSGAGRGRSKVTSLFSEVDENVAAYGLLTHRHTAEMEMALGRCRRHRWSCCSHRTSSR